MMRDQHLLASSAKDKDKINFTVLVKALIPWFSEDDVSNVEYVYCQIKI
jgi:hypothetical protein